AISGQATIFTQDELQIAHVRKLSWSRCINLCVVIVPHFPVIMFCEDYLFQVTKSKLAFPSVDIGKKNLWTGGGSPINQIMKVQHCHINMQIHTCKTVRKKHKELPMGMIAPESFDLPHLGGQQLSKEDISELKEFYGIPEA
ncbi:hypothetical protein ACJX0J_030944, partial [Zea mays]